MQDSRNLQFYPKKTHKSKKHRNGDTLGPLELIVWLEQGDQGDWREQDDQVEVSFIIFGMSKSSVFKNITYVAV